jgi:hypothetical protein
MVKVLVEGTKVTRVPVLVAGPTSASGTSGTPWAKRMKCSLPSRQIVRSSHSLSALTTLVDEPGTAVALVSYPFGRRY